jgi:hemoglobin
MRRKDMKVTLKSFLASVLLSFSLVAPVTPLLAQPPQTAAQQPTLYKRLGGYDALAAVTDDFLGRLTADTQLKRFFIGHNTEALKVIRQHIIDFLCQTTGGPCAYHGRDMKTAHTGLGITEDDWSAMVKDLTATFDKFKVPDKERGEVLSAVSGLKADIVGK